MPPPAFGCSPALAEPAECIAGDEQGATPVEWEPGGREAGGGLLRRHERGIRLALCKQKQCAAAERRRRRPPVLERVCLALEPAQHRLGLFQATEHDEHLDHIR